MEQADQALQWASEYLVSYFGNMDIHYGRIVETAYSIVHRIHTGMQVFYLKQTPELLFLEPKILSYLKNNGITSIPELLAENPSLNCFLMSSCGDISLRHFFNKNINVDLLKKGIIHFTNMQRALENKNSELFSIGVPDWRLEQFSSLYYSLIQKNELLISDGLTEKEIAHLHQLHTTCIDLCNALSTYRIPETLTHCDFHDNNMLMDDVTKEINIIDWGETVLAHPFFSLNGCLWNLTYFYGIKETDLIYKNLQSICVSSWKDEYEERQLINILNMANTLQGIFSALAYERMYISTEHQQKTVQQQHHGSIAGCLRTYIKSYAKSSF